MSKLNDQWLSCVNGFCLCYLLLFLFIYLFIYFVCKKSRWWRSWFSWLWAAVSPVNTPTYSPAATVVSLGSLGSSNLACPHYTMKLETQQQAAPVAPRGAAENQGGGRRSVFTEIMRAHVSPVIELHGKTNSTRATLWVNSLSQVKRTKPIGPLYNQWWSRADLARKPLGSTIQIHAGM